MTLPDVIRLGGRKLRRVRGYEMWTKGMVNLYHRDGKWVYDGPTAGHDYPAHSGLSHTPTAALRSAIAKARAQAQREYDRAMAALDAAERELAND